MTEIIDYPPGTQVLVNGRIVGRVISSEVHVAEPPSRTYNLYLTLDVSPRWTTMDELKDLVRIVVPPAKEKRKAQWKSDPRVRQWGRR